MTAPTVPATAPAPGGIAARLRDRPEVLRALLIAGAAALLLFATLVVFPNRTGSRGVPVAILFSGLVTGATTAVVATGIVLIHRSLRFINFAQAAMGVAGAVLFWELVQFTPVPMPLALVAGVGLSAAVGAVMGIATLRFFRSARLFMTVLTILFAEVLTTTATQIRNLPFFPPATQRTSLDEELRGFPERLLPFEGWTFHVGSFQLQFGFRHVLALELAVLALVGLWIFLRWTRAGTAIRALAGNSERAALLGIGVGALSITVWAVAGALAGTGMIMRGAITNVNVATGTGFVVLLPALAAAVVGRFERIPTTVAAAVLLEVFTDAFDFAYRSVQDLSTLAILVVVAVALLVQARQRGRSEEGAGVTWAASEEPRPVPRELTTVPTVRWTRLGIIGALVVAVVAYPYLVPVDRISLGGVIALQGVAVVSLVVLTGWAGQVSLGQLAFMAVGAVVGGGLADGVVPFWLAVPVAAAVSGLVAFLVGLPALRIRGMSLLVATFAFAIVVRDMLFDDRWFGWLLPEAVDRPTLLFVDFESERAMYYLSVATLAAAVVAVTNLRRSRVGRLLIAVRDNEPSVRAFGVSATRIKLLAFSISGALCGMAGAVFAAHQRGVSAESFRVEASIDAFVAAVFGGVSSVTGALLGAAYFEGTRELITGAVLRSFVQNGGTLLVIFAAPAGLIGLLVGGRDALLRIVAQRHQLRVPALTGRGEPEDAGAIPLDEPDPDAGLSVLPPGRRWALASELYIGRGERIVDRLRARGRRSRAEGLAAAARAVEDTAAAAPVPAGMRTTSSVPAGADDTAAAAPAAPGARS